MQNNDIQVEAWHRLHRRRYRYNDALENFVELNSNTTTHSDAYIERITAEFSRARDALRLAEAEYETVLRSTQLPLFKSPDSTVLAASDIVIRASNQLLKYLADHPQNLFSLHWRTFEELVARIFSDLGYNVDLMPATHDGGKDIIVHANGPLGPFMTYIECKHQVAPSPC